MRSTLSAIVVMVVATLSVATWLAVGPAVSQQAPSLAALAARAAALEREVTTLEDVNAIKRLQRVYGFYTDKQLWSEAADLFAADGSIEVGGRGVYVGRDRILEFLRTERPGDAAAEALVRSHAVAADRARRGRRFDRAWAVGTCSRRKQCTASTRIGA